MLPVLSTAHLSAALFQHNLTNEEKNALITVIVEDRVFSSLFSNHVMTFDPDHVITVALHYSLLTLLSLRRSHVFKGNAVAEASTVIRSF
ncbi:hypothetical protein CDAR_405451 [Caerostris darwini]|uniref:Uncharacterized protein n=1 Tax=Caerostris darwini TaxID=1538125 RepID=A0AAV4WIG9_9ARAC|nr:hypothetical protein CDAR_405451 [Caerostris darwini]